MSYAFFNRKIRDVYLVIIKGWPTRAHLVGLSRYNKQLAMSLLDKLRTGQIYFAKIHPDELARLKAQEARMPKKSRKVRSDNEVTRALRPASTRGKKRREGSGLKTPHIVTAEMEAAAGSDPIA